jgi:hypothetical protein
MCTIHYIEVGQGALRHFVCWDEHKGAPQKQQGRVGLVVRHHFVFTLFNKIIVTSQQFSEFTTMYNRPVSHSASMSLLSNQPGLKTSHTPASCDWRAVLEQLLGELTAIPRVPARECRAARRSRPRHHSMAVQMFPARIGLRCTEPRRHRVQRHLCQGLPAP